MAEERGRGWIGLGRRSGVFTRIGIAAWGEDSGKEIVRSQMARSGSGSSYDGCLFLFCYMCKNRKEKRRTVGIERKSGVEIGGEEVLGWSECSQCLLGMRSQTGRRSGGRPAGEEGGSPMERRVGRGRYVALEVHKRRIG